MHGVAQYSVIEGNTRSVFTLAPEGSTAIRMVRIGRRFHPVEIKYSDGTK